MNHPRTVLRPAAATLIGGLPISPSRADDRSDCQSGDRLQLTPV